MGFFSLCALEYGIPTSVDFIGCDPAHMVTSFSTGNTVIYDLETSQSLVMLSSQTDSGKFVSFVSISLLELNLISILHQIDRITLHTKLKWFKF